jgi:hypothetical protein
MPSYPNKHIRKERLDQKKRRKIKSAAQPPHVATASSQAQPIYGEWHEAYDVGPTVEDSHADKTRTEREMWLQIHPQLVADVVAMSTISGRHCVVENCCGPAQLQCQSCVALPRFCMVHGNAHFGEHGLCVITDKHGVHLNHAASSLLLVTRKIVQTS